VTTTIGGIGSAMDRFAFSFCVSNNVVTNIKRFEGVNLAAMLGSGKAFFSADSLIPQS